VSETPCARRRSGRPPPAAWPLAENVEQACGSPLGHEAVGIRLELGAADIDSDDVVAIQFSECGHHSSRCIQFYGIDAHSDCTQTITEFPQCNPPGLTPIFDGHNDVLLPVQASRRGRAARLSRRRGKGQLDLPMAVQGGFAGGLSRSSCPRPNPHPRRARGGGSTRARHRGGAPVRRASTHYRTSRRIEHGIHPDPHRTEGQRTVPHLPHGRDIRHCMQAGALAAVSISKARKRSTRSFETLDVLHQAGLRSLGPVWSRPNAFGHGRTVPLSVVARHRAGLDRSRQGTDPRRQPAENPDRPSHLNERGWFWDVAALSDAPLVATHSNAHALSPHSRNLTDRQLTAIRRNRRRWSA